MNTTLRTRLLAVLGAGTLVGVLGGSAVAFAGGGAAVGSADPATPGCTAVSATTTLVKNGAEGRSFGTTGYQAQ